MDLFDLYATIHLNTNEYDQGIDKVSRGTSGLTSIFGKTATSSETLGNKIGVVSNQYKSAQSEVQRLTDAFNKSAKETGTSSKETQELGEKLKEAESKSAQFKGELDQLTSGLRDKFAKAAQVAKIALAAVGTAVVTFGVSSVKTGMDFDASMSKVAAISGATGSDFDALRDKALEMGRKTTFSASESAEAFQYMAMAGWKTNDMLDGIDGVMNLAAASGENLATVSDIVTDAMTAFGLEADKSGHFADILAAAASNSNTNVGMLGESFKYVAPLAGAMGYSAEDVATALGLMANNGIKASQGGTALKNIIANMTDPTDEMAAAMETLGVTLEDDEGRSYSFMEVLQQLREGFGGGSMSAEEFKEQMTALGEQLDSGKIDEDEYAEAVENLAVAMYGAEGAQKAQLASMLAGKYGLAGLLAIVNTSEEDFNSLADSINNSSQAYVKTTEGAVIPMSKALEEGKEWVEEYNGSAEAMAAIMRDNLKGDIDIAKSAFQDLQIAVSDKVTPALRELVEWGTNKITAFSEAIRNGDLDGTFQKIAVAVGAAAGGFIAFKASMAISSIIQTVSTAITALKAANEGLTIAQIALNAVMNANPFVLVATVIGTLVGAFVTLLATNEDFRNKVKPIWEAIKNVFIQAWNAIKAVWDTVKPYFEAIWNAIKSVFSVVATVLGGFFKAAWSAIKVVWDVVGGYFQNVWNTIKGIFSVVKSVLSGDFKGAWEAIKGVFSGWGDFFGGLWNKVKDIFKNVGAWFKDVGHNIVNGIKEGILAKWEALKGWVSDKIQGLKNLFTGKSGFDTHSPSKWARRVFENVMEGAELGLEDGESSLMRTVNDVIDDVQNGFGVGEIGFGDEDSIETYTIDTDNMTSKATGASGLTAGSEYSTIININIDGANISDSREMAETIAEKLQSLVDRRQAVWA